MKSFNTIAGAEAAYLTAGQLIWNKDTGAVYYVKTLADYGATPDGYVDRSCANTNVLVLQRSGGSVDITHCGAAPGATDIGPILQAVLDVVDDVTIPAGDFTWTTAVTSDIAKTIRGAGAEVTRLFMDGVAATAATVIGVTVTDAADGSDRWGQFKMEGMSLIRQTETGGVAIDVTGVFAKNQKAILKGIKFRGDTTLSASPYYFHHCGKFSTIRGVAVENCNINGNIDTTADPSGQVATIGFESIGDAGHHYLRDTNIFTVHTAYKAGDGVEGWRIHACNFVNVVVGVNADTTLGEPGGWINDVHINAMQTAITAANRTAMEFNNLVIFRSDNYYEVTEWNGLLFDSVARSNFNNVTFQPQDITTNTRNNVKLTGCQILTFGQCYHTGGNGFVSGDNNDNIIADGQEFHALGGDAWNMGEASDTQCVLGTHQFLAMTRAYAGIASDVGSYVQSRHEQYGNVATTETTFSTAGTTALLIDQQVPLLRYFCDTGAGAYTRNIDLRADSTMKRGDAIEFLVRFAASTNPTIRFRDGSAGPVIKGLNNASGTAKTMNIKFAFDGADWFEVSSSLLLTAL